jgi:Domain of unknown function (DUF1844)
MAELQKNNSPVGNAEMAQRFVQFVMMQTQNIYYLLGRIPSQDGRPVPPNLEGAKLFIDQLEMVQEKTRNNLSTQEAQILEEALKNTRLAFVEASGGTPASMMPSRSPMGEFPLDEELPGDEFPESEPAAKPETKSAAKVPSETPPAVEPSENKKKFTKSYG